MGGVALSLHMHDSEPLFTNAQIFLILAIAFLGGLVAPVLLSGPS